MKLAAIKYKIFPKYRKSYSQCGEDIIVSRLLRDMRIDHPFYLDIGTNDPVEFNNTYLFYKRGSRGICVEPNPLLSRKIARKRPRDICLQVGVGSQNSLMEFFVMDRDVLSTFSPTEAAAEEKSGHHIVQRIKIPIRTIPSILKDAGVQTVDFLSLDIEGMDKEVLESIDFKSFRPKIICVETKSFAQNAFEARKSVETFMSKNDYDMVGFSPINSIFRDKHI